MSPKTNALPTPVAPSEATHRFDATPGAETVLTLATSADRYKLRSELLRLIINSEQRRRKQAQPGAARQEHSTTEGSAHLPTKPAEA